MKYISQTKFPKKVRLWLTISEKGMSKLLFFCSGLAVNEEISSTKCLPEVVSFIKKYHKGEDTVSWPDLASAHYSKRSLEEMENFWANLKRKIYSNNLVAKTEEELIKNTEKA